MATNGEIARRMRIILDMEPEDPASEPHDDIRRVWFMAANRGVTESELRAAERQAALENCPTCGQDWPR